jgi:putative ABC transport system ATP-binding protein
VIKVFIEMEHIVKKYGSGENVLYALNDATLSLENGEFCVILGPSGSGKSTLLNILGGLDRADEGRLVVGNDELSKMNKKELALYRREKIGIVFQTYNLIGELTVRENVKVVSDISKKPLDTDVLLEELGLKDHKTHFPSEISGGQQQRCAIARAVVKNPKLLLCDEPTGALDSSSSRDVLELLQSVNKKYKTTIVLITHNEEIAEMADRVVRIRDGRITENRTGAKKTVKELIF